MEPVKVGLLGLGTVGRGVVDIIRDNQQIISARAGRGVIIKSAVVRDLAKAQSAGFDGIQLMTNAEDMLSDPDIDIVCELMGGTGFALEAVLQAIASGKHVVTANKALIATHGNEIFRAAEAKGVSVAFESSVAGGIPVIKALREGLAANNVEWLAGIINGTSNFILTEMASKGRDFADVLAEAQALGYAEADPTFDVEGVDAAHKLTILASLSFGIPLNFEATYVEGISQLTTDDVAYANELGYAIKHLGMARMTEEGAEIRVHPTLIPKERLIANVNGVMNAVLINGDAVGPTLYYGAGAGGKATGSAVIADVVDIVRTLSAGQDNRVPYLAFQPADVETKPLLKPEQFESAYYLRMVAEDRPGVMAAITSILGEQGISIEAMMQKEPGEGKKTVPMIMLTRTVKEGMIDQAIARINALDSVKEAVMRIRVEHLG